MAKKTNTKKVVTTVQEPNMWKTAEKKVTKKGNKKPKVTMQKRLHALFEARPKKFLIGQDLPPKR